MRDILPQIREWLARGERVALATVIRTWGSSPRPVGAHMAINAAGEIAGSVSGGCVEGAVAEAGLEALQSGRPRLLHFGVADETAWSVGLSCGGQIDVFVCELLGEQVDGWEARLRSGDRFAVATLIRGPQEWLGYSFFLDGEGIPSSDLPAFLQPWDDAVPEGRLSPHGAQEIDVRGATLFVNWQEPPLKLIVVGGVHIAIPLVTLAKTLGYHTVVVDPRRMFGSAARFPHVDELITAWPQDALEQTGITAGTAVAMLTHDPKIDDPALVVALRSPAFYVGALGSRKTHQKRRARLLKAGLTTAELDRLHAPIGLDLGGRAPEEIALAVMAEIVQARYRGDGRR